MTRKKTYHTDIQQLDYQPSQGHERDLEIFLVSELRERLAEGALSLTYRYAFPTLIYVTQGACTHEVDFLPVHCEVGSLLVLPAGVAHSFGHTFDWDGVMVLFRPEFLWQIVSTAPDLTTIQGLDGLPIHMKLNADIAHTIITAIEQMRADAQLDINPAQVHSLLRHQLYELFMRLRIAHGQQAQITTTHSRAWQRFKDFEKLLEAHFTEWHYLPKYAAQLGCSEKSLIRAAQEATGNSAKNLITARLVLEVKRMLTHTDWAVSHIAEQLGFHEATNFIKFFKRETGDTPLKFRQEQRGKNFQKAIF